MGDLNGPVLDSVLDGVGATPLVRLRRVVPDGHAEVWVKTEWDNPGGSVKDRAALAMVLAAERSGALRPGGTIVEGTSGNTGIGLAMVAARGYRSIMVIPDRTTREKVALLRAYGAEIVTTPALMPLEDPWHVKQLAATIAADTPDGWLADQYANPANPDVHERTTGPEIWAQTGGRVTHLVAGAGTGGTITGAGRYLKGVGDVTVVGADPETSRYGGGDGSPYYVEAVGHYLNPLTRQDVWPEVYDTSLPDRIERIPDGESLRTVRTLARSEGLLVGGSAGTAVAAALRVAAQAGPGGLVVAVLPDSGRIYLSKYFDDEWLTNLGFLDSEGDGKRVRDVIGPYEPGLVVAPATTTVAELRAELDRLDDPPRNVTVVLPRRTGSTTWSVPDVLGTLRYVALGRMVAGDRVGAHADPPPATVGHGEDAGAARDRLDAAGAAPSDPVLVLVDGRAVTQVSRAKLG